MRNRWANALKVARQFRSAVRGTLPVTVPNLEEDRGVLDTGLEVLTALESLPLDACQYLYLKMRTKNAMRYSSWAQHGAAAYEAEMVYHRIRALTGEWACRD